MERFVCSPAKISLRREPLNQGGYDANGRYFGRGEPLIVGEALREAAQPPPKWAKLLGGGPRK